MVTRTARAESQMSDFSMGSMTFKRGCARGLSTRVANPATAASLTPALPPSNASSPVWAHSYGTCSTIDCFDDSGRFRCS